jgi:hypothetical protein
MQSFLTFVCVTLIGRYGDQLKLLTSSKETKEKLVQLLKRSIVAIQSQQQGHQSDLRIFA